MIHGCRCPASRRPLEVLAKNQLALFSAVLGLAAP